MHISYCPSKMINSILYLPFLTLIVYIKLVQSLSCNPVLCPPEKCFCPTTEPIFADKNQIPQLVMLTFDDAVNRINYKTYKHVITRKHQLTGCPLKSTFFVTHEYTDYLMVHDLWRRGNEIAIHSITHEPNLKMWENASEDYWKAEMGGMKELVSHFAHIPKNDLKGVRIPFLQSSGDRTWKALKEEGFLYDSSISVRNFVNPPLYPYTMDFGLIGDCQIEPCPTNRYPGFWEIPMIQYKMHDITLDQSGKNMEVICAMVDACTPNPNTTEWTYKFLMDNFLRHYNSNRAPFPIFMHEFWLLHSARKDGFFRFLDTILAYKDVFFVSPSDVIKFLTKPSKVDDFARKMNQTCIRTAPITPCAQLHGSVNCEYKDEERANFWPRYIRICGEKCPNRFPWLHNPFGV